MYTDEDLNLAVQEGIFTEESVEKFRALASQQKNTPAVDEENFRLIGGFNDIFVVIACLLLLFSSLWVFESATDDNRMGLATFTILSWCLAEFFVRKRKMALPAIALLLSFVGGCYALILALVGGPVESALVTASAISAIAAYIHWLRFRVPITVAVGLAAAVGLVASSAISVFPEAKDWLQGIIFICGLLTFAIAMYWDASDTHRTTRQTDVAFWLHLLSAPLIIHPIFSSLGVLDGHESLLSTAIVVLLYVLMTLVSIAIDRRALMVSSLVYVLYAITSLIEAYGNVGHSFALTGVFMGSMLLLLSAFWQRARRALVTRLPHVVKRHIPQVQLV